MNRLSIHPNARVFGPDGRKISSETTEWKGELVSVPDHPVEACIESVLKALESGVEFCVHPVGSLIEVGPGETGFLQCVSSGSTGAPKRIRRSYDSWWRSFQVNGQLFEISETDHYGVLGSLSHSLSLYALCEALALGTDISVLAGLRPDRQTDRLSSATVLYATPTQLRVLSAQHPVLTSLRLVLIGGGALDDATRDAIRRCAPNAQINTFYGASETSFITMSGAETPEGSVGLPYPGVDLVLKDERGHPVSVGEPGEIWVRSPYLFDGYATGEDGATRAKNGWISVGEVGIQDESGNLTILGRVSRMFTVSDQNVFPEEIESWLLSQRGVADAVVLPAPDAKRGQVPVAYVCGAALDTDALLRHGRQALGPIKAPRHMRVLSDLPKLPSGKPDLQALEAST